MKSLVACELRIRTRKRASKGVEGNEPAYHVVPTATAELRLAGPFVFEAEAFIVRNQKLSQQYR